VRVVLNLPDPLWARLATIADEQDTRIPDLLQAAVAGVVSSRIPPGEARREMVARLVRAGLTDGQIADRLRLTRGWVAQTRREAGLRPNHHRGRGGGINNRTKGTQ